MVKIINASTRMPDIFNILFTQLAIEVGYTVYKTDKLNIASAVEK